MSFLQEGAPLPEDISEDVRDYLSRVRTAIAQEDPETQKLFIEEMALFIDHAD